MSTEQDKREKTTLDQTERNRQLEIKRAERVINGLDERIDDAVKGNHSRCIVMTLDPYNCHDYDFNRFPCPTTLERAAAMKCSPDLLTGAARIVAEWFQKNFPRWRLAIEVEREPDDDRYIYSAYLTIAGWPHTSR